jgi:hypothetical protein
VCVADAEELRAEQRGDLRRQRPGAKRVRVDAEGGEVVEEVAAGGGAAARAYRGASAASSVA